MEMERQKNMVLSWIM